MFGRKASALSTFKKACPMSPITSSIADSSARLALPYIIASQAQKHLTHNEALAILETLVQPVISDIAAIEPPIDPAEGNCVVVASGATGVFAGKDSMIAAWIAAAWHFHTPQDGWSVVRASDRQIFVYGASGWAAPPAPTTQDNLAQVGINAAASSSNRLTVASDASLFTAQVDDHRMTINKAGTGDTASLVFQSGWSARAEMGLAGEDGFSIKVSADGSAWHDALSIAPSSGLVRMPARPAGTAYIDGGTVTFSPGDVRGFAGLAQAQGGVSLGTPLVGGTTGAPLIVPADGLYQLSLTLKADSLGAVTIFKNATYSMAAFDARLTSAGGRMMTFTCLLDLYNGDELTLRFDDAATCYCYNGTTYLDLVRL